MKKLALLIIPALFLIAPAAHADDDATSTPSVDATVVTAPSTGYHPHGNQILPTSAAQKRSVLEYRLSLLLAEWKHVFGVEYPNTK